MANFTPQEIEEMLQEFFDTVGKRQYVGARYVPIFGRAGSANIDWDNSDAYEPLTIVLYHGDSYTSRRYVPAGVDISNADYWVITGRYNAQVEQYRQQVLSFQGQIDTLRSDLESDYVPFPDSDLHPKYGTLGQVLSTLADGTTLWQNPVVPSDAQAEEVITQWLNAHPEATTTVQDDSITYPKIKTGYLPKIFNVSFDGNTYASAGDVPANSYIAYTPTAGHQWADLPNPARFGTLISFTPSIETSNPTASHVYGSQLFFQRVNNTEHVYYRTYYAPNHEWSDWKDLYTITNDQLPTIDASKIPALSSGNIADGAVTIPKIAVGAALKALDYAMGYDSDTYANAGAVPQNSIVAYTATEGKRWADLPNPNRFGLLVSLNGSVLASTETTASRLFGAQLFFQRVGAGGSTDREHVYFRTYYNPTHSWSEWTDLYEIDAARIKPYSELAPIFTLSQLFPLSGESHKIALFGDSITQGTGSTGQIAYTKVIDGVNYTVRGNGPDYPDAGSGYQIGKYLGRNDTSHRMWYEQIDGDGWGQLLKRYLESAYANVSVLNAGMAGASSQDLINNIPSIIENENITYAIVMIGTNDRGAGTLGTTIYPHLQTIVDTLLEAGINVLLMTPIPASNSDETAGTKYFHMNQVAGAYTKVASRKHVPLFDLYSKILDYIDVTGTTIDAFLPDGLHPNDASYRIIFNMVSEAIGLPRRINGATW